jgi:hypothetical protein
MHSGQNVALTVTKQECKPEADIQALGIATLITLPEQTAPFMRDGQPNDSVFRAAAKLPLNGWEWELRERGHRGISAALRRTRRNSLGQIVDSVHCAL